MNEMDMYNRIAGRAAKELEKGSYVNLGIGIPTLVANYIVKEDDITLHTETGLLGYKILRERDKKENWFIEKEYIDATGNSVELETDSAILSIEDTFMIMRGGHLDVAILGAYQVDSIGQIANWTLSKDNIRGIGGAMDLMAGAKNIIITMTHTHKDGSPKIVEKLSLPKTSNRSVNLIITELAVIKVLDDCLELIEVSKDSSVKEVLEKTDSPLKISDCIKNGYI